MAEVRTTKIKAPASDPHNIEAVKHYVFNQTGNIMLSTTDDSSVEIQQSVRDVFAEVAVFFAAMTKAISTTPNPNGVKVKGKLPYYSLYNLAAIEGVIDGSGCFIHVSEEDVSHTATSFGANFSKDLIEALLGLASGTGELAFASAMVQSVGKEGVNIGLQTNASTSKVANIVFVCEYLLGMPVVSALVVSADATTVSETFTAGPCFKETSTHKTLVLHKDTYMFVTPAFIKEYAGDLNSGMNDPAYLALIDELQRLVARTPSIEGVYDLTDDPDNPVRVLGGSQLVAGRQYSIYGVFLGDTAGTLALDPSTDPNAKITPGTWGNAGISFTIAYPGTAVSTKNFTIQLTLANKKVLHTSGSYPFAPAPH